MPPIGPSLNLVLFVLYHLSKDAVLPPKNSHDLVDVF